MVFAIIAIIIPITGAIVAIVFRNRTTGEALGRAAGAQSRSATDHHLLGPPPLQGIVLGLDWALSPTRANRDSWELI